MAKKSYDVSEHFSSNQKGMIKDEFNFSPAQKEHYNYKDCVVGGIHIGGVKSEPRDMYDRMERREQKRMEKYEQARELD